MRHIIQTLLFCFLITNSLLSHADNNAGVGMHESTSEDVQAITKVTEDFRKGLITKDTKLLSSLMLNSNVLFSSAASPENTRITQQKMDVNFDGISLGGYKEFALFLFNEKKPIEEKFYNIKITQDGHVAWVMFDYEFVVDGKTENYGIETWQLIKTSEEKWKIFSVVWSVHLL